MVGIGLKWILFRRGWAATTHLESGGFVRTEANISHPNIQFHFLPSTIHDHGRKMGGQHAFQVRISRSHFILVVASFRVNGLKLGNSNKYCICYHSK